MFLNPHRLDPATVPIHHDNVRFVFLFGQYRKVGKRKVVEYLHRLRHYKTDKADYFVHMGDLITPNGNDVFIFDGEEFLKLSHSRPTVQHCRFCPCRLFSQRSFKKGR